MIILPWVALENSSYARPGDHAHASRLMTFDDSESDEPPRRLRREVIENDGDLLEEGVETEEDEGVVDEPPREYSEMELNSLQAISILNGMRAARGLSEVQPDYALTERCFQYAQQMSQGRRLIHDRSVYGTPERENIAGASGYPLTVEESMRLWEHSGGHAAAMFDRGYFPTAVYAGYAQFGGYSCLRLCPLYRPQSGPCSDASAMTLMSSSH